jgi:hypothetical protein
VRLSPLILLLLLVGCRRAPESVLLTIEGKASPAAFLRLSVYDDSGVTVRERPLGSPGTPLSLPATVVLYPPGGSSPLRIDVRAILGAAIESEGTTRVAPIPDQQVAARIVLRAGALPDLDADGVPDELDNCRALANADQRPGSCPSDAGPDRRDAPRDGGVEGSRDLRPDAPADASGDRPRDQGGDLRKPDLRKPDLRKPDLRAPDLRAPDLKPVTPDLPVYQPVTAAALSTAFAAATVPCINAQGVVAGSPIVIVDTSAVSFVVPPLASAPAETVAWLGGKPAVVVVWDPNACDAVELPPSGPNWQTAGLLIRGATLDAQNRLQLATGTTLQEIDLVDVDVSGVITTDHFLPDDTTIATFPQLVQPVLAAKQLVLQLATP